MTTSRGSAAWHEDCIQCFYCEMYLARRHEHDHFPLRRSSGGASVVPVCVNCHDLKDRVGLRNWPLTGAMVGFQQIFDVLVPREEYEARIELPVPHGYPDWLSPFLDWSRVAPRWNELAPVTRVLYGKLSVIEQMRREDLAEVERGERLWRGDRRE